MASKPKPSMKEALKASVDSEMTSKATTLDRRFAAAEALVATHDEPFQTKKAEPAAASKVMRDTFSMPEEDYLLLEKQRSRARRLDLDVNRSELVRIGIRLLGELDDRNFEALANKLDKLKRGRRTKA